jgi:hypothetical protein
MLNWIQHHGTETLVIYMVFSAFAGMWEAPDATSSKGYRRWFSFINSFAMNFKRAFGTVLPSGRINTAENAANEAEVLAKLQTTNLAAPVHPYIAPNQQPQ